MKKLYLIVFALGAVVLSACKGGSATVETANLRTEMKVDPVSIDIAQPQLMWQLKSGEQDVTQSAYRIIVAASQADLKAEQNLVWDSGEVTSDRSVFISYAGQALESGKTYYWRVKAWTNKGETPWSDIAQWGMGLLNAGDWQAKWVGVDRSLNPGDVLDGKTRLAARYLRKEFDADKIASARLYITGLGFYECYINGTKVGADIFAPTATDYTKRVNYNTYDVTKLLAGGKNTIGVILGNGRYFSMRQDSQGIPGVKQFGFPKMIVQLELTAKDGSKTIVASDENWKLTTNGPIISNSEFDGEEYDARLELKDWAKNGFDDSAWINAELVEAPAGKLIAQNNPNIKTQNEIQPIGITAREGGSYMIDMGQNMVGWLAVKLNGKKDQPIKMVFAESLKDDGSLYLANLRGANVTDIYTPSADGAFSWEPRFTYHGFRFVEISGLDYEPALTDFTGKVNYDQMCNVGSFETSDSTINQIYHNAYWGIIGNYRSMPTDCPQRDERMGWLGDRGMGCYGESFVVEQELLYEKWLQDIEDAQLEDGMVPDVAPNFWWVYSKNITWPAAYVFAANMLYEQYGNDRPIKSHYASMKRWIEYVQANLMTDNIVTMDTYGDWCMPPESPELIHSQDPGRKTDGAVLSTTFFYQILTYMSKFAQISGNDGDKAAFDELAAKIREAYNAKYLNTETGQYSNNTVTANMLSLMQGLVPEGQQQQVFGNIVEKTVGEFDSHVSTGLVGQMYLMRGLTKYGRGDLAMTIATNRTYPSWGYMIENGATTIWELWNGNTADPAMNSHNHVMLLGDLVSWYYENIAGFSTDKQAVGFKKVNFTPLFPDKLDYAKGSFESVYGLIASDWKREGDSISWSVEIPANTSASVQLPEGYKLGAALTTARGDIAEGSTAFDLPSGKYTLTVAR